MSEVVMKALEEFDEKSKEINDSTESEIETEYKKFSLSWSCKELFKGDADGIKSIISRNLERVSNLDHFRGITLDFDNLHYSRIDQSENNICTVLRFRIWMEGFELNIRVSKSDNTYYAFGWKTFA